MKLAGKFPAPATLPSLALLLLGLTMTCLFMSCETDSPPSETVLRLKLNDSLSRYEKVVITIVDKLDMTKVIDTVWSSGALAVPSQVPIHDLAKVQNKDNFVVRVVGYSADDQIFLETLIFFASGTQTVVHQPVPPYKPRNQLTAIIPSAGKLSPGFQKDSTKYRIIVPEGVASITLMTPAVLANAQVVIKGEIVKAGTASSPIAIGTTPDTVSIQVTDISQAGSSYTREYQVVILPTLPSTARLANIIPSVGTLVPAFDSLLTRYEIHLPPATPSISFKLRSAVPSKSTMQLDGKALFDGESSPLFEVPASGSLILVAEVHISDQTTYYYIILDRLGP